MVPTGPWFEAMRSGDFDVVVEANCHSVVNPLLDVAEIPAARRVRARITAITSDPEEVELYDKMLRETDSARQRALMRQFETPVIDTEAHEFPVLWWYRIVPYRSYVQGLEDQPEPLHQSGSVRHLAGQGAERLMLPTG